MGCSSAVTICSFLILLSLLVKPSASCRSVGTYCNSIYPRSHSCRVNFSLTSTCLVLPLNPIVLAEMIVAWLSQNHGVLGCLSPNSSSTRVDLKRNSSLMGVERRTELLWMVYTYGVYTISILVVLGKHSFPPVNDLQTSE